MDDPIPFARPFIGREEEEAVLRVLRSGWLTTGKETLEFEKEFAAFLSPPGEKPSPPLAALAVNSATSGLHLALEACGIGPGDLVLVPSLTFTSTAEAARYLGAEVVFVDAAPGTFHINAETLEKALRKLPPGRAKAVIPVHYGGLPCAMEAILSAAAGYGLKVIEDAAHSFPSRLGPGGYAGTLGDAGVFSFYATKTITTGEGGMVVTRDAAMTERISVMRSHGIDRSVWNRYTDTKASWYYEVAAPGFKYNIPDILSALGRVQLARADSLLALRQNIALQYDRAFGADGHFTLPPTGAGDARHLYPLRINPQRLAVSRNGFIEKLQESGIGVSVHFIPLHTMPYYKKRYSLEDGDFPESMAAYSRTISLPIWPGMTARQVERVITVVKALALEYNR
ncbi:MAG: DegT/DnrJ/EryC1/StrS aminotransferase family protein [Treponema sp.]|jgi:dTDP-4-amino-4,6-dideoxygalactose transaminase|nr:DegT/DnrJ/EryC1/StrS aminotransferase family protein [Treponema sp.]